MKRRGRYAPELRLGGALVVTLVIGVFWTPGRAKGEQTVCGDFICWKEKENESNHKHSGMLSPGVHWQVDHVHTEDPDGYAQWHDWVGNKWVEEMEPEVHVNC